MKGIEFLQQNFTVAQFKITRKNKFLFLEFKKLEIKTYHSKNNYSFKKR